jgi:hypothetical protein
MITTTCWILWIPCADDVAVVGTDDVDDVDDVEDVEDLDELHAARRPKIVAVAARHSVERRGMAQ